MPLLSRQISVEKPSEPDISTASLWVSLVCLAERHDVADRGLEFLLGQPHFAGEFVQVTDQGGMISRSARIFDALIFLEHRPW